jgi:AcrR family transcriptional regulator
MSTPTPRSDPPAEGRREANKREKLERIRAAAREVFVEEGFEAASLREIAARADVAFGTLFLYAKNKGDLLLLLFDDQLPEVSERALERALPELAFIDQLVAYFGELYEFFCRTPDLSRAMMRETTFTTGIVSARVWEGTVRSEGHIARLVSRAQAADTVSPDIAPAAAAHVLFSLYRIEIRFCLDSDEPDVPVSLARLREQLELVNSGLAPRARSDL